MSVCQHCGTSNADTARFCQHCGSALSRVLEGSEERKLVTVLFIDIVGSTARADRADPEDVKDFLRRFHDPVREQVARYGGAIEKFIGDAVVAVFGAPRAHEDDAERAVRCALQIVQAVGELDAGAKAVELTVRAGVTTGEAVVTLGSAYERGEPLATGDVLSTASRLQSVAPPGRVVVDAETYFATRRAIRYDTLAPVAVKGKSAPLEVWLAIGLADQDEKVAPATQTVGRDEDLALLMAIYGRARRDRHPHLVNLVGPPGIGKSRLATEFGRRISADGGRELRGRSLPYEEQAGYAASVEHIKQIAGILGADSPQSAREKLTQTVSSLVEPEEATDVGHYLSLLLGLGLDEPTQARQPLFLAVRRLIEGFAAQRPILFVFEDLQWAGQSQLDLLDHLVTHVRDVPVVFLALSRTDPERSIHTTAAAPRAETTIPLEPLTLTDASAVIEQLLGQRNAIDTKELVEVAGGNPLFLEELAASVSQGAYTADGVPGNVRSLIASRIDALPSDERTVLLNASVIGPDFWRGVLAQMDASETSDLDVVLDTLEGRDFIRRQPRSQLPGDTQFSFKHALIREVAYGTLPRPVRRARHSVVAHYLETNARPDARETAPILAHHWRHAGKTRRAVDYLLVAAERAREAWARDEALALYASALELVREQDSDLRTRIRLKRALAMVQLADFVAAVTELDQLLPELSGPEELEAVLARCRVAYWLEDTGQAYRLGERGRQLAEQLGDPKLLGPAIAYQGLANLGVGELEKSLGFANEARSRWVGGSRSDDLASLYECLADVSYWVGDYQEAEDSAHRAYEMGSQLHSVEPMLRSGGWRGLSLAAMGRTEEAIVWLDSIFQRAQDLDPRWGAAALNYSTVAFRDVYMLAEARRRNQQALEIVAVRGAWGMPELMAEIDLALLDLDAGEVGRVQEKFPSLWDAAINGKAWRPWMGGLRLSVVRAEMAHLAEGPNATVEHSNDVINRARKVGRPKYEATGLALLGSALVELGRAAEGIGTLRRAVDIADQLGGPTLRWQLRSRLAKALYAAGDDDNTAVAYRDAAQIARDYASRLTAEHAASFFKAAPVIEVLKAAKT
jgi:class 3 adenylate cyclase